LLRQNAQSSQQSVTQDSHNNQV